MPLALFLGRECTFSFTFGFGRRKEVHCTERDNEEGGLYAACRIKLS
jgi:hypothetical protein